MVLLGSTMHSDERDTGGGGKGEEPRNKTGATACSFSYSCSWSVQLYLGI